MTRMIIAAALLAKACKNERAGVERAPAATEQKAATTSPSSTPNSSSSSSATARKAPSATDSGGTEVPAKESKAAAECRGGEVRVVWHRFVSDGEVARVRLSFGAAGHRSWEYDFAYEAGVAVSAEHQVSSWAFAGGSPDEPQTRDKVLRRTYELEGGELKRCYERRAEGPSKEIEKLVDHAARKEIACAQGKAILELATNAKAPIDPKAAWLIEACESDPSSGMKL